MKPAKSLSLNALANAGGYAVAVVTAFVIAPITIRTLGDTRYGAWVLVSEVIGYYGLLDLGIRGAVSFFVARYAARDQQAEVEQTVSTAFWLLAACGTLAWLIGVGLTLGFPYIFKVQGLDVTEAQTALFIMSTLIAISLPMNAFGGALVGKQRFDITAAVEAANRVLTAILVYVVLKAGGGLIALALVQAGGRLFSWSWTLVACRSVLGGVFGRWRAVRPERVRQLVGYGIRNAIGETALLVIYRLDLTVIGVFVGVSRITGYSIAGTLVGYASALCTNIAYVFTPRFAHLASRGDDAAARELYFFGLRVTGLLVVAMMGGLLVFGRSFITLWLGPSYVSGAWSDRSDVIMIVLIAGYLPHMLQSISRQRLFAMAKVRFLMWLNVGEAAANLVLSVILAKRYGPVGVAFGTLIPLLVTQLAVMPRYTSRVFQVPLPELLRRGFAAPLTGGLLMASANVACLYAVPPLNWGTFFFDVAVCACVAAAIIAAVGLTAGERRAVWERISPLARRRPA